MRNDHASMGRKRYLSYAVIGNFFCFTGYGVCI